MKIVEQTRNKLVINLSGRFGTRVTFDKTEQVVIQKSGGPLRGKEDTISLDSVGGVYIDTKGFGTNVKLGVLLALIVGEDVVLVPHETARQTREGTIDTNRQPIFRD